MDGEGHPSFKAINSARLREAGLRGKLAIVTCRDGALEFVGEEGGGVKLSAAMVDRMRVGFEQGKSVTIYQAMVWPKGEPKPILIYPHAGEAGWHAGYNAAIRAFSASLATHGIGKVERGVSSGSALFNLVLATVPAAGFTAAAVFASEGRHLLGWFAAGLLFWGLAGIFLWIYLTRQRPQPVKDLAELERQLPKIVGT
jgi:hypothetical protein